MVYFIIIILILIKAIFSAMDTAITYINRAEIRQLSKKDKKAQKIKILMEDNNKFFGTIEVGINMCELFAGAVVSITILEEMIYYLENISIATEIAIPISVFVVTAVLAYVMLVFGGVLPKRIARNSPQKTAYKLINIVWVVSKLNYPFERLIDISTDIFSKIFNIKREPQEGITEKQLKMIIREAKDEGVLEIIEKKIFMNTLKANDTRVGKIMIPIEKIYSINIDDELSKILEEIKEHKYTRIPVYENSKTNIIGIFNLKDIAIQYTQSGINNKEEIRRALKTPKLIHKNEKIFNVLKDLQKNNKVIAIVVDENNIPVGLVSIEDILEKLVGKIFDEDDKRD